MTPQLTVTEHESTLIGADQAENLLAIDTSLGTAVGVSRGSNAYALNSDDPLAHAEAIGVLLQQALQRAELAATDITGVVMGVGPGPFTGLRVGMAAAISFATARNVPLYPVLSHDAAAFSLQQALAADPQLEIAQPAGELSGARAVLGGSVQIMQDARRKELFISDYQLAAAATVPTLLAGPSVVKREGHSTPLPVFEPSLIAADSLLQLATLRIAAGADFVDPAPRYLRDPDVRPPAGVKSVVVGK